MPGSKPGNVSTAAASFRLPMGVPPRATTELGQAMPDVAPYQGTTAKPVATRPESAAVVSRGRRGGLSLAIVGVVAGVVAIGGGVVAFRSSSVATLGVAASAHVDVPVTTVASVEVPALATSAVSVVTLQPLVEAPSAAPEVRDASSVVGAPLSRAKHGTGSAALPTSVASAGVTPAPPAHAPGTKSDCNPDYTVDSTGMHHFKPECFE